METFDCIKKRCSVREYKSGPISKDLLNRLIDAGRRAPTARHVEPWEFIIVENKEVLKKLGDIVSPNGTFVKDAAACVVIFCKETKYYLEDGCAAAENILLAAADLGLGACWVAGDKKPYMDEISKFLGVPTGLKLISLISLGWPKNEIKQAKTRTVKDVIHWEKF